MVAAVASVAPEAALEEGGKPEAQQPYSKEMWFATTSTAGRQPQMADRVVTGRCPVPAAIMAEAEYMPMFVISIKAMASFAFSRTRE